jgi:uncharacterized RmlC-like cupin family protein
MENLDIYTTNEAITVQKKNGTNVNYFLFDEYEIHLNRIPPKSLQEWHMHKIIEEVVVVTSGEIYIDWITDDIKHSKTVKKDTLVRVKNSIHTIENKSEEWAEFIVFRMVPTGKDNRELMKSDKVVKEQ